MLKEAQFGREMAINMVEGYIGEVEGTRIAASSAGCQSRIQLEIDKTGGDSGAAG